MELKDLRFNLKIRVYGEGYKTQISHGFLVDDMPMGVSAPVGEFVVDVRTVTLAQLRPMLMYDIRGAMKRRSMLWQEVLFIFGRLPNIYDRPKSEVNKFQFGFVRKSKLEEVKLIHPSREFSPISELIGATDFFSHDLVIVPVTQLSPELENAPAPPLPAPAAVVAAALENESAPRPGSSSSSSSSSSSGRPGSSSSGSVRAPSAERKTRASSPPKPGSATLRAKAAAAAAPGSSAAKTRSK